MNNKNRTPYYSVIKLNNIEKKESSCQTTLNYSGKLKNTMK